MVCGEVFDDIGVGCVDVVVLTIVFECGEVTVTSDVVFLD